MMDRQFERCPETIWNHSDPDRDGKCAYCRKKIASRMSMPRLSPGIESESSRWYRIFYDPDWGSGRYGL